jgi:hypothetical protein
MTLPANLDDLASALDAFCSNLLAARERTPDLAVRQQLAALTDSVRTAHGQFLEEYRRMDAALDKRLADTRRQAEDTLNRIREAQARLQEAEAAARVEAPAASPPPPEPPVDLELGGRLRDELLDHFGNGKPSRRDGPEEYKELWEDWK